MRALLDPRRAALAVAALLAACNTNAPQPIVSMDAATQYCANLGYALTRTSCGFPDGSTCATDDFFDGSCGQKWTYCEQHGGTISTMIAAADGATPGMAICNAADGEQCTEASYALSGLCD